MCRPTRRRSSAAWPGPRQAGDGDRPSQGTNTEEEYRRNFGMPSPDGYRKAVLRLMKQAKIRPSGHLLCRYARAFCGLEKRRARRPLPETSMRCEQIPVLRDHRRRRASGGAPAMATADEVWMLENSIYSILSPEGLPASVEGQHYGKRR